MAMASRGPILHKAKTRSKQSIHLPSSRVLSTVLASGGAFRGRAGALAMLSARWGRRPAPRRLSARPLHDGRRACCWPSAGPRAGDAIKLAIAVGLRPMAWRGSPDALIRALLATLLMAPAASAHAWYTRACRDGLHARRARRTPRQRCVAPHLKGGHDGGSRRFSAPGKPASTHAHLYGVLLSP